MPDTAPDVATDPVRSIHEFALSANILLSMRGGKAPTPARMWELASGSAAAWYAHRLLQRLAEVDPDGVTAFAETLAEEGEMPEVADNPVEVAQSMGFDAQAWINAEFARQDATPVSTAASAHPIDHLRAIADSARHAIALTREQRTADATEHVHAIERLITAYHIANQTVEA
ncbi:SusD/RagB family nutrient-binding outer membrane lipoprotein (plasmid) [Streptomyces sp. NBC_01259]|uniref:hypothetical protein n=1 Tax=Streptomyces sp. NBC_01259 TaxID=2903800 RepID=UPI002F907C25